MQILLSDKELISKAKLFLNKKEESKKTKWFSSELTEKAKIAKEDLKEKYELPFLIHLREEYKDIIDFKNENLYYSLVEWWPNMRTKPNYIVNLSLNEEN